MLTEFLLLYSTGFESIFTVSAPTHFSIQPTGFTDFEGISWNIFLTYVRMLCCYTSQKNLKAVSEAQRNFGGLSLIVPALFQSQFSHCIKIHKILNCEIAYKLRNFTCTCTCELCRLFLLTGSHVSHFLGGSQPSHKSPYS